MLPGTNQEKNSCENIIPRIEILNISSDSGSEKGTAEHILAFNKNCLPKITDIGSLGKNNVKLVKDF